MVMKYTPQQTQQLLDLYDAGTTADEIALNLGVPTRSVIAKLSSLGVYKKKSYVDKQGQVPVRKEWYIQRIGELLDENIELLESLEKVNKRVLHLLVQHLDPKP